jgi:hypothetical protein
VSGIVRALAGYDFDRIYGGWWSPAIRHRGKQVLARSAQRYIELLSTVATPPAPGGEPAFSQRPLHREGLGRKGF